MILDSLKTQQQLLSDGTPFVVITMVDVAISAPQKPGAKLIAITSGLRSGTIGGGKLEAKAIAYAQELLADDSKPRTQLIEWNLKKDVGMTCGGIVKLFFEVFNRDIWTLNVFGAGHISQALVPILLRLETRVTVVDSRPEWLGLFEKHQNLRLKHCDPIEDALKDMADSDYYILVSKGHSTDIPVIRKLLKRCDPRYLGVIGSQAKSITLTRELKHDICPERLGQIHCPIGLNLGGHSPSEIAISIVAQVLQVRHLRPQPQQGSSNKNFQGFLANQKVEDSCERPH